MTWRSGSLTLYRIIITQTLFGHWALIREWGRIGSLGTVRETWYDSEEEALETGEKIMKQKANCESVLLKLH